MEGEGGSELLLSNIAETMRCAEFCSSMLAAGGGGIRLNSISEFKELAAAAGDVS